MGLEKGIGVKRQTLLDFGDGRVRHIDGGKKGFCIGMLRAFAQRMAGASSTSLPRHITPMRRLIWRTMDRSCAMNSSETPWAWHSD